MASLSHSFDLTLASKYGVDEAILIHHFQHWVYRNKKSGKNLKDGRTWTYQTIEEIAIHFPYWTKDQIREIIDRLVKGKNRKSKKRKNDFEPVLIKGNFNKSPFDTTTWYAFADKVNLQILVQGEKSLLNPYGVIDVSPLKYKNIHFKAAMAFTNYLISDEGQKAIADFKVNGRQVFHLNVKK